MSEEKMDLSSFDGIADRVARAKAKAEAIRAAKAAGGTHATHAPPPSPVAEIAPGTSSDAPEPVPAGQAEHKVDLSNLDAITDRVARAKAKAEAVRAAKAAGVAHPATASSPKAAPAEPRPKREVSAEAMAAKKAQARAAQAEVAPSVPSLPGGNGAAFCVGMTIRRGGKLARVVSTQYENVCLVYEDNPGERVMTKSYRLEVERQRGTLQFASPAEFTAAIPPSAGNFGRALAFLAAAGGTGILFLGAGLVIGPLSIFPTLLIGYILFALAYQMTK